MLDFKHLSALFCSHSKLAAGTLGYESQMFSSFSINGYHVYQNVWSARVGEQLTCNQEPGNCHDTIAGSSCD